MALFGLGRSARRPGEETARRQVEAWAREAAGLDDADVVKANEIQCADPACPGFETVILIMRKGQRTRAVKVVKPMSEVTREDVGRAVAG